jgi:hypothetical protein
MARVVLQDRTNTNNDATADPHALKPVRLPLGLCSRCRTR